MTSSEELELELLATAIDAQLPQTQCTRCGYVNCAAYAQAIATEHVPINQCPPGGDVGIVRLANLTGQPITALNPENGTHGPRAVAVIDETWCIGCTLCLDACPTDAIVGSNKQMHTVIEPYCTGCELCVPVCPVDCIQMDSLGHDDWPAALAEQARERYRSHNARLARLKQAQEQHLLSPDWPAALP